MAEYTRQLVRQNGCEEVITVLQGRAEEISLTEKVDVLVSEWMGNCLLVRAETQGNLVPYVHKFKLLFTLLLLSHARSAPSLSSWWSRCCWPETAG